MPARAVVLGGSSDIARALLARLVPHGLTHVLLAGRDTDALEAAAVELGALGPVTTSTERLDVTDIAALGPFAEAAARRLGRIDLVVVAAGELGTADLGELDAEQVAASIATNLTGPAAATMAFARVLADQGGGRLLVLSSAAGVRVRRANFVYGSAKAGLDGFCQGLGDALIGSGVSVVIVRPGFVHTKMTAGRKAAPLAVGPEEVAEAIERGLRRGVEVIWVPGALRPVFAVIRMLPRALWRRVES